MRRIIQKPSLAAFLVLAAIVTALGAASASGKDEGKYTVTNLVSDQPGVAPNTDRTSSTPGASRPARPRRGG